MREVLRYHVRDADDDAWSLERIDQEVRWDGQDPEHYADILRDDMGFDELDHVCRNLAAGHEWDYEPEPVKPATTVKVEAGVDSDKEVGITDDIPF